MPAWITSLLRDEVTVPTPSAASSTIPSRPASASRRAMARPIPPAPITTHSTLSIRNLNPGLCSMRRSPQLGAHPASTALAHHGSVWDGFLEQPVEFVSECLPDRGPVSEALIIAGQLP